MITATIQAYNKFGDIYLNNRQSFDNSKTLAMMWVEKHTWTNTTGVHFIDDGYFEILFKKHKVEFEDTEKNRFIATLTEI